MSRQASRYLSLLLAGLAWPASAEEKVTYDDHVVAVLRNNCFKCHNPDKAKADLDLTTYGSVLKGGSSGKAVVPGDAAGSKLYKSVARIEEPFMPNNAPKLPDAEIELIRKWIANGLLEKSSSRGLAATKSGADLLVATTVQTEKPDGPAILPVEWLMDPVQHTERATAVTVLAASPWAPLIAVGGEHQLLLYNTETREPLGVLPLPDANPTCVQFSRNSKLLVVGRGRGAKVGFVDLYDVATGALVTRVGNEYDTVLAADLNVEQSAVALGGPAKHVKVFSTRDGRLLHDLKKHTDWITAIQFSPDGVLLATGDRNGGLVIWEADTGQELYTFTGHTAGISAVSWRDDSNVLLSASEDGSIYIWEIKEGHQVTKWTAHKEGVLDARFAHDSRIVSCGRDKHIAVWDGAGKKQRDWEADGELPARVAFSHDGSNVLASSSQGRVGVWSAADGKPRGEISSNPLTLNARLESAKKDLQNKLVAWAKAEETQITMSDAFAKAQAAVDSHDRSSATFRFVTETRQAHAAQQKALDESRQTVETVKAVAAKSGEALASAQTEASKLQVALEKAEKFSAPYKALTQELEAANQKIAVATTNAAQSEKALANKTAAANAAAAELVVKFTAATQSCARTTAVLAKLAKQSEAATQKVTQLRVVAAQDKTKLTQQETIIGQAKSAVTNAEAQTAKIKQVLNSTNESPAQSEELTKQLEVLTKQFAEGRVSLQSRQKSLAELKAATEKSGFDQASGETDLAKIHSLMETNQTILQASKDTAAMLKTAHAAAVEAAKKELDALQITVANANMNLVNAKTESNRLHAKLESTEKFSDAFKEATRQLDAASKKVADAIVPTERDHKELADLQGALDKIAVALTNSAAEAAKVIATMTKNDPSYQRYLDLTKQLDAESQKASQAKSAADIANHDVFAAQSEVAKIQIWRAHAALYHAREILASRQQEHDQKLAALNDAEEEIKAARAKAAAAAKEAAAARFVLNTHSAANASQRKAITDARSQLTALGKELRSVSETLTKSFAKRQAAQLALAHAVPRLAVEKARVDHLATEYAKWKKVPTADVGGVIGRL